MVRVKKIIIENHDETKELTLSEIGYRVQEDQVERLLIRFEHFSTVEITDLKGRPLTLPLRRGRDGGLDVIFTIRAHTSRGTATIFGKVKKILIENDY